VDELINTKNGIAGLIASLVVILALQLMWRVFEFCWGLLKKKTSVTDKNMKDLIETVQQNTVQMKKIHLDLRRSFKAIKFMSGDKWNKVRSAMMGDEDLPS
jgi:hypothetical protein